MQHLKQQIQALAKNYFSEIVEIRRHLHTYPELSFEEYATSNYIVSKLKEYNIPFVQGIVKFLYQVETVPHYAGVWAILLDAR